MTTTQSTFDFTDLSPEDLEHSQEQREKYGREIVDGKPYKAPRLKLQKRVESALAERIASRGDVPIEIAQRGLEIMATYRREHGHTEEQLTTHVWLEGCWDHLAAELGLEHAVAFAAAEARRWPTLGYMIESWAIDWYAVRAAAELRRGKLVQ